MTALKTFLKFLALGFGLLVMSGCFDASEDDSQIPWGRPADFENRGPGFGPGSTY